MILQQILNHICPGPSPSPSLSHPASLILRRGRKGEEKTELIELHVRLFSTSLHKKRVM